MVTTSYRKDIVTNLGKAAEEVSRTVCVNSIRLIICALFEVGCEQVRKPKVPEGCPEVTVRENSDVLTWRAEEVGTVKTYIIGNHFEKGRWDFPLVDCDHYFSLVS